MKLSIDRVSGGPHDFSDEKHVFYEQVTGVEGCSWFFLYRVFSFVVVLGFVALHRVSIRTLDELS